TTTYGTNFLCFNICTDSVSGLWVTMREYYCYKLYTRPSILYPILHGGWLFQQFAVDTYIKIESSRQDYIWHNQKKVRAELYQGLLDTIQAREQNGDAVGKWRVLCRISGSGKTLKVRTLGCARRSLLPLAHALTTISKLSTSNSQNKGHMVFTGSGHRCGVIPYSSVAWWIASWAEDEQVQGKNRLLRRGVLELD
uniref:Helitron helicase-like domain-containing protein n=1 Tax=Aegilops tauschii subsp. strangulata TaxID=200361 RepID=A0A453BJF4_AEGTS